MDQNFYYILITENECKTILSEPRLATRLQEDNRLLIDGGEKVRFTYKKLARLCPDQFGFSSVINGITVAHQNYFLYKPAH
jgi:hypothetical protein